MSWEHAAEARAALNAIVTDPQHGVGALSSAQTMSNLLKDLLPDAPREKSILVAAAEAGLAGTLRQHVDQGMDPDTAIRLTASSFSSTTPFTPEACNWVTGEIATALGMSHSDPDGGAGGGFGATPAGFDPIGQQGMPTRPAPIPGVRYTPAQQPAPGFGQPPAQGGFGIGGQPAAQGPCQPGVPGWQPGGGYGPAGQAAPMGPIFPGGPGGPVKSGGRGRAMAIAGGIIGVLVVVLIIVASLSGGGKPHDTAGSTPPPPTSAPARSTPATSPAPLHPPGTDALVTIMNPTAAGEKPVGTDCGAAKLYGLKASTLDASTFCSKTTRAHIVVWGYQFDSASDYQAGLAHINHFVGFDKVTPGTTCPPPSGSTEGKVGWHAKHNPKYFSRSGQDIECLVDAHEPVLIWTMPTQDVFFVGEDQAKSTPIKTIISWWETLTYG